MSKRRHGLVTRRCSIVRVMIEAMDKTGTVKAEEREIISNAPDDKLRDEERRRLCDLDKLLISFKVIERASDVYYQTPEEFVKNGKKL